MNVTLIILVCCTLSLCVGQAVQLAYTPGQTANPTANGKCKNLELSDTGAVIGVGSVSIVILTLITLGGIYFLVSPSSALNTLKKIRPS